MNFGEFLRRTITVVVVIFVSVFILSAMIELKSILLTVFFCWVLSVGLNSLMGRFERMGMPRSLSALSTLSLIVVVMVLIAAIVIPPFVNQFTNLVNSLPSAAESAVESYGDLRERNETVGQILPEFTLEDYNNLLNNDLSSIFSGDTAEVIDAVTGDATEMTDTTDTGTETQDTTETIPDRPTTPTTTTSNDGTRRLDLSTLNVTSIVNSALPIIGGIGNVVGSLLANLILIILITGYLIADPLVYYRPIIAVVPKAREARVVQIINEIRKDVTAWMGGLSISITYTTIGTTLVLGVLLQIPNAFALGVIAGVATIIPNVGYYIGLFPILIFTAAVDPVRVIPAAILYWVVQQSEGSLVTPNIMRRQLNLPAGILLPFQLIAAVTLGFYGILLAVPILAIIVSVVQELYVYDMLGKRGWSARLQQNKDGIIILNDDIEQSRAPEETEPEEAPE
ncbi:MAG: AI-2E family transporter [Aggregatilineales bacterium]